MTVWLKVLLMTGEILHLVAKRVSSIIELPITVSYITCGMRGGDNWYERGYAKPTPVVSASTCVSGFYTRDLICYMIYCNRREVM